MPTIFETACVSLEYFVVINNVTSAAFSDKHSACMYYDYVVRMWTRQDIKNYFIKLMVYDGSFPEPKFNILEEFSR